MVNSLYTAASGMTMQQRRLDVIASNLSNMNTVGHKRELPVFAQYMANPSDTPDDVIRDSDYNKMMNSTVRLYDISTSFDQGNLRETANPMDMALGNPNAFFAVDTPFGIRFTRDGEFSLNDQNQLITKDGFNIVSNTDSMQPVIMRDGMTLTANGELLLDGAIVGNISIVEFEDTSSLQKVGNNLYVAIDSMPEDCENPGLITGYLEGSNVNPITEMVNMIEASRGYETYSKIITTLQDMDSKAVGQVGLVS